MFKKILLKIKAFLKKHISFSKDFIHPVINENLSDAIDDKLTKRKVAQGIAIDIHTQTLNNYLHTYFSKLQGLTPQQAILAYDIANRNWRKYVRNINSTNKLINLNKDAFEIQVKKVLEKMKVERENPSLKLKKA